MEDNEKRGNKIHAEKKEHENTSSRQVKNSKRNLKIFLIVLGISLLILFIAYFLFYNFKYGKYNYEGIEFKTVQEGKLILYKTVLPVFYQGKEAEYNLYLRTNPRQLVKIPFEGKENLMLMKNSVINFENNFSCDGDEVIAIANFAQMNQILNSTLMRDEDASCDLKGRYNYINLQEGNETKIVAFGPNCYNIIISNCEILKATEKYMVEFLVKYYQ